MDDPDVWGCFLERRSPKLIINSMSLIHIFPQLETVINDFINDVLFFVTGLHEEVSCPFE